MLTYKDFLKINETWLTLLYNSVIESYTTNLDIFSSEDNKTPNSTIPPQPTNSNNYDINKTNTSTIEDLFDGINGDWRNDDEN